MVYRSSRRSPIKLYGEQFFFKSYETVGRYLRCTGQE
jgi:hypothetical protein